MAERDDRRSNGRSAQRNDDNTIENVYDVDNLINTIEENKYKDESNEKKRRREKSYDGIREEVVDEANDHYSIDE